VSGVWLWLRLAIALAVVLAPGWAIARALGVRGVSATLAWALAALFAALGVTFLVHGSIALTFVLLAAIGLAALLARRRPPVPVVLGLGSPALVLAGLVVGVLLWHVAGEIGGDGFFHLGRTQRLLAVDDLSPGAMNEFPDGGLHPGYAFPLWHALLALVAWVGGVDPVQVVLHLPSLLVPLTVLVWVEAGFALFRRRSAAIGVAAVAVAVTAFAPQGGGAYTSLALPATSSRQLLAPAVLALAFACVRAPRPALLATAAAATFGVAVVHPSYAVFVWIPFGGFLLVRALWARSDVRAGALTLAALVVPSAVFILALIPIASDTVSVSPDAAERAKAFETQYAGQLRGTPDHFSVVPELFSRSGAITVAALLLAPLAILATRRRWAAYVVGGGLAIMLATLVPAIFTPLSDMVSVSQGRRLVGFFPYAFAVTGGLSVAAALLGPLVLPVALAAGIVLRLLVPGDFGYRLTEGGPGWVTWVAVAGMVVALVAGARLRVSRERAAALAVGLLVAPTVVASLADWTPSETRPPSILTPGLVAAVVREVPVQGIVYGGPEASYQLAAFTPVRICLAPPGHVADTVQNRPRARVDEYRRFLRTGDRAIPRACGARWLLVDRVSRPDLRGTRLVYRDARWALWQV
jgi:hypothetical protein